jgi:hypothetical protein
MLLVKFANMLNTPSIDPIDPTHQFTDWPDNQPIEYLTTSTIQATETESHDETKYETAPYFLLHARENPSPSNPIA